MVKDRSDSERGIPLPPHGLLFPIRERMNNIISIEFYTHNNAPPIPIFIKHHKTKTKQKQTKQLTCVTLQTIEH